MEILDAPAPESGPDPLLGPGAVRELPYAAWVNIQTGCDNSCAFCIVPSVRGPEVSRPLDDIVAEVELLARRGVTEVTLLGQNVNSYGRDITRRRPLFAESAARRRRGRGHRAHPLHQPAPQGPAARDDRGHGRDPGGLRAAAPAAAVRERPRCCAPCGAATPPQRYLERLAAARAAIDDLAVTTDVIVGFPGETEDDFEDTLAVCAEAGYDSAYTFIFSPRPGTRAAAMESELRRPPTSSPSASSGSRRWSTAPPWPATRPGWAAARRCWSRASAAATRPMLTGRTRQGKLVHFPGRGPRRRPRRRVRWPGSR